MYTERKSIFPAILLAVCVLLVKAVAAHAHCQIPCGIYDDRMRINMMAEDIATIEKSMNQINDLSKQTTTNLNQVVRWVQNKDTHADKLSDIVTEYFMSQRLQPVSPADGSEYRLYLGKLTILHSMLVEAMKAKQTTDLEHVEVLRKLLDQFVAAYFPPEKK